MSTQQQEKIVQGSTKDDGEEEDYGKLIYNEYRLRRKIAAEAAAAAAQQRNEKRHQLLRLVFANPPGKDRV